MNVDEYINSGILQDYCLGLLSSDEAANVEALCKIHAEISIELNLLQLAMKRNKDKDQLKKSAALRKAIWEAIKKSNKW